MSGCKNQRDTPCPTCPFLKGSKRGHLGGGSIPAFVGQVAGPFFLPCHSAKGYSAKGSRSPENSPQCVGAAAFRERVSGGNWRWVPIIFRADVSQVDKVFRDYAEFAAHHASVPVEDLDGAFSEMNVRRLTYWQLNVAADQGGSLIVRKRVSP